MGSRRNIAIIAPNWPTMTKEQNDIQQDKLSLSEIEYERHAKEFGTPFYLYDADAVLRQVAAVRNAFHDKCGIYFAVKANPNLRLLEAIRSDVHGLDISSAGELEQALLAGYDPDNLSFAGPAKTINELRPAIECGVGSISVESERELRDIICLSQETGKTAKILLRINPEIDARAYGLKMAGRPVQFGIDEEHMETISKTITAHREVVEFRGLHVYAGSQGFQHKELADGVTNTLGIAKRLQDSTGIPIAKLNMGGGFGVSHTASGKQLDLTALADELNPVFEEFLSDVGETCELIFELGRYLVADAGVYVVRVISVKESRGQYFAVTDGGLHHHLSAAGNFGVGFRSNFELRNISNPDGTDIECNIAGPSCNPTDLLGQKVTIPKPKEGDLLAVLSSGSYGLTASPIWFLGRRTPAEIVRVNGDVQLGRRSQTILDFN